jgi:hypothetical protein
MAEREGFFPPQTLNPPFFFQNRSWDLARADNETWYEFGEEINFTRKIYILLVAGERYRLSLDGSNPRYFLRSFAWSIRIQAMAARSETRA